DRVRTNFTFDEVQSPIVVAGYHHEWSPQIHTLFLGGRLMNDQSFSDQLAPEFIINKDLGKVNGVQFPPIFDVNYQSEFKAFTTELEQIVQSEKQTLIIGGRLQGGQFETSNDLVVPGPEKIYFLSPAASTNSVDDFGRAAAYAYYTVEPLRDLFITTGL